MSISAEAPALENTKPGFWARQYRLPSTQHQRVFDLLFGIIAPLLCLFFDPIVFRADMGRALLPAWRLFGYLEIGLGIVALSYYLLTRRSSLFLSGALWGGALFAALLGIQILPFALIGLFMFIGIFGLTPFVTAFVYWRNGCRASREAATRAKRRPALIAALGAVLVIGVPLSLHFAALGLANRALVAIQTGSERDFTRAVETLKYLRFAVDTDEIAFAYQHTSDEKQRQRLAQAFHSLTGQDVEDRLGILD